jgi:transcriptional regulator with XRE-family HTH domain
VDDTPTNRLREWRERKGLTRRELANLLGCHLQTELRLEKGKMKLTQEWLDKFAQALKLHPSDLLADRGYNPVGLAMVPVVEPDALMLPIVQLRALGQRILERGRGDMLEQNIGVVVEEEAPGAAGGTLYGVRLSDLSLNRIAAPGAVIVLDRADAVLVNKGYYAIEHEGMVLFRQYLVQPARWEADSTERLPMILHSDVVTVLARMRRIITKLG